MTKNVEEGVMSPYSAHSNYNSTNNPSDGVMEPDDLILLHGVSLEPPNSSGALLIHNLDLAIKKNRSLFFKMRALLYFDISTFHTLKININNHRNKYPPPF